MNKSIFRRIAAMMVAVIIAVAGTGCGDSGEEFPDGKPSVPQPEKPVEESGSPLFTALGDSRTANSTELSGNIFRINNGDIFAWAVMLSNGAIALADIDHGINSITTGGIITDPRALAATIADPAPNVVFLAGVNDYINSEYISLPLGSDRFNKSAGNIGKVLDALGEAGKRVFLLNELPRTDFDLPAAMVEHLNLLHEWCGNSNGAAKGRPWVVPVDIWSQASPDGSNKWRPGYADDGLHPNQYGAMQLGIWLGDFLSRYIPTGLWLAPGAEGELVPNPFLSGSGGTTALGLTGSVPDNFAVSIATGFTMSTSRDKKDFIVELSGSSSTGAVTVATVSTTIPVVVAVDDRFDFGAEYALDNTLNIAQCYIEFSAGGVTGQAGFSSEPFPQLTPLHDMLFIRGPRTKPAKTTATSATLRFVLITKNTAGSASARLRIRSAMVRKAE
jgi:lysophospholipase L1-like esterase